MRGSLQLSLLTQRWFLLILVAVSLLLEALSHFSLESHTQNLCGAIFCQLSSLSDCNMQRLLRMGGFKETTQPRFPSHTPLLISPAAGTQNFKAFITLLLDSLVSPCLFLPYYNKKKLFFLWINVSYACLVPLKTPCTALDTGLFISRSTFTFLLDSLSCQSRADPSDPPGLSGHWFGWFHLDPLDHQFICPFSYSSCWNVCIHIGVLNWKQSLTRSTMRLFMYLI